MEWSAVLGNQPDLIRMLITLAVGIAAGLVFKKAKVPAGYMVGAFVAVGILGCTTAGAWVPDGTRTGVQIIAGAFVGCSMERSDLRRMKKIGGPVAVMLFACLGLMILAGFVITAFSDLDLRTSLMCAVPGGINDTPVVAADMGADAPSVAILQLVRQVLGIAILPAVIAAFDKRRTQDGSPDVRGENALSSRESRVKSKQKSTASVVVTILVACAAGALGKATHIPGMTFAFSIAAVLVLKLGFDFAFIPKKVKIACQLVAGCYLGTLVTQEAVLGIPALIAPIAIVVLFYTANCFVTGRIESRLFGYGRKEGMLIASPAGASDMALIMDSMGIENTDVVIMQVVRAVVVMACFPQIVNAICSVIGV